MELRFDSARRKAHKYAANIATSTNLREKHRNEVEMAYHTGKAEAYAEIINLLTDGTTGISELKNLIERTATEVLQLHNLKRLKGEINNFKAKDGFEDGVEALKERLIRVIDPEGFKVSILVLDNKDD